MGEGAAGVREVAPSVHPIATHWRRFIAPTFDTLVFYVARVSIRLPSLAPPSGADGERLHGSRQCAGRKDTRGIASRKALRSQSAAAVRHRVGYPRPRPVAVAVQRVDRHVDSYYSWRRARTPPRRCVSPRVLRRYAMRCDASCSTVSLLATLIAFVMAPFTCFAGPIML